MFKAVLVDNEQTIRNGIKNSIDWERLGIYIAGEASDGQTALRLVNELSPDILITDIKMPFMDGLELSELALKAIPELKVILISGFDDFKYAQRGIQLGVSGYLLKPVKKAEMNALLIKTVEELNARAPGINAQRSLLKVNVDTLMLEKFFRGIIYGKRSRRDCEQLQKQLMGEKQFKFLSALIQLDNYMLMIQDMTADEQEALSKMFFETADSYFSDMSGAAGIASENYTYQLFLYDEDEQQLKVTLNRICMQLKQIMLNSDMSISIGIGSIYDGAYGLKTSFDEAKNALKYKFVMGLSSTIYYSSIEQMDSAYSRDCSYSKQVLCIMDAVKHSDKDELKEYLEKLTVDFIALGHMSRAHMSLFISDVFKQCMDFLETIDVSVEEIFQNPIKEYSDILNCQTMNGAADRLFDMLCRIIDYIGIKKQGRFSCYIDKAKRYIEEHYTDSDINLEKIAGRIQMSVSYFSLEFKKGVGKTYIEFLTELRINRAKQLLLGTSLKVSEISEMVGYENPTYFNYLFKQNIGVSPGQFRKISLSE